MFACFYLFVVWGSGGCCCFLAVNVVGNCVFGSLFNVIGCFVLFCVVVFCFVGFLFGCLLLLAF